MVLRLSQPFIAPTALLVRPHNRGKLFPKLTTQPLPNCSNLDLSRRPHKQGAVGRGRLFATLSRRDDGPDSRGTPTALRAAHTAAG